MNSWEKWNYPTYFFQASDVPQKYLRKSNTQDVPSATVYDVVTESKIAEKAAVEYASDAPAHLAVQQVILQLEDDGELMENEHAKAMIILMQDNNVTHTLLSLHKSSIHTAFII